MRVDAPAVCGGAMRQRCEGSFARRDVEVLRGARCGADCRGQAGVAVDGGRSVATGADGSASGRELRERSEVRR